MKQNCSEPSASKSESVSIREQAESVLKTILRRHEDLTVMISSREGRVLTSTLNQNLALEQTGCILNFTDKAKVLVRKLLNEELSFVRIRGIKNEIVITFDEANSLEIITIQEDNEYSK